jgi:hypothetical protein
MSVGVIESVWVGSGGRDLGVDSLATELVIDRCGGHGRHRRGGSAGAGVNTRCIGGAFCRYL